MTEAARALADIRRLCDENLGPSRSSLLDRIAHIADSALAALPPAGWRDISTAPKDGTTISVWHKVWRCPISARYIEGRKSQCKWVEATITTEWPDDAFTHWMPLPPAPQRTGE